MSHLSPQHLFLYAEGELAPDARRSAEAHLVACEACRRHVVELRAEAQLLVQALREPERHAEPLKAPARDRGLLVGLPVALVLAAGASAILERRLAAGVSWLSPARLLGATDVLFDLVFLLRDRAPGLLEFAAAVAATATLAALVTALAGLLLRRVTGSAALVLAAASVAAAALLAPALPAAAAVWIHGEGHVHVAEGEVVEGALLASGDTVRIDGTLRGSLVAFAEQLVIRGRVEGDVYALVRDVKVSGTVEGTLHVASRDLQIAGRMGGSTLAAVERLDLHESATIQRDLVLFASTASLGGGVGRDLLGRAGTLSVTGSVGRDVEIAGSSLSLEPGSQVAGALRAHVRSADDLVVAPGAQVGGDTEIRLLPELRPSWRDRYAHPPFYLWLLVRGAGAFLVGLLLFAAWPALFSAAIPDGRAFAATLGRGAAWLVLAPPGLLLLALTLVGLPAAILGAAVYAAALYASGIVVAVLIGRSLRGARLRGGREFAVALALGLAVLLVATQLPFVGFLVRLIVVAVGLGLLVERARVAWGGRAISQRAFGRSIPRGIP